MPAKVQWAIEESVERLHSTTNGEFERSAGWPLFKEITASGGRRLLRHAHTQALLIPVRPLGRSVSGRDLTLPFEYPRLVSSLPLELASNSLGSISDVGSDVGQAMASPSGQQQQLGRRSSTSSSAAAASAHQHTAAAAASASAPSSAPLPRRCANACVCICLYDGRQYVCI